MATMYSLFFGLLFTALCGDNGDGSGVLSTSMPAHGIFILLDQNEAKIGTKWSSARLNQGLVARLNNLNLCGTFYQGKVPRRSANEDKRNLIIAIASKELGIHEATGNNDGPRIEQYLRYTNLSKGYDWCASFVSWTYGQAGLLQPRNPWSPALFPKVRQILKDRCQTADVFGIYGVNVKRINHVGLIKKKSNDYLITIEGNSNNRVESRRRHLRTIYAIADWVGGNQ